MPLNMTKSSVNMTHLFFILYAIAANVRVVLHVIVLKYIFRTLGFHESVRI